MIKNTVRLSVTFCVLAAVALDLSASDASAQEKNEEAKGYANGELHMLTPGRVGVVRPGDFVRHIVPKDADVKLLVIWASGGEAKRILDYTKGVPMEQK